MADFKKTEADFAYERYAKLGGVSPEQDIPRDDIRPVGTETAQSLSGNATGSTRTAIESPFARHERAGMRDPDADGIGYAGDSEWSGDPELAADVGLREPAAADTGSGSRELPGDNGSVLLGRAPERDDLVRSDALLAAGAAGLSREPADLTEDEYVSEEEPLEDVPDADAIQPGTPVDPAAPPADVLHGTDLLNGSTGEDE